MPCWYTHIGGGGIPPAGVGQLIILLRDSAAATGKSSSLPRLLATKCAVERGREAFLRISFNLSCFASRSVGCRNIRQIAGAGFATIRLPATVALPSNRTLRRPTCRRRPGCPPFTMGPAIASRISSSLSVTNSRWKSSERCSFHTTLTTKATPRHCGRTHEEPVAQEVPCQGLPHSFATGFDQTKNTAQTQLS